jgi:hypothetical protein
VLPVIRTPFEFNLRMEPTSGCWLWAGSWDRDGYGYVLTQHGKKYPTHRYSFERFNGVIPDGLQILHKCDVRSCVNPQHLFLGSIADNMLDKVQKGRQAKGETSGRKKHPERYCHGTDAPGAKLNEEIVHEIRKKMQQRTPGLVTALAKQYGVSRAVISEVAARRMWAWVEDANGR